MLSNRVVLFPVAIGWIGVLAYCTAIIYLSASFSVDDGALGGPTLIHIFRNQKYAS